jgi:hypothetical protein
VTLESEFSLSFFRRRSKQLAAAPCFILLLLPFPPASSPKDKRASSQ